VGKGEGNIRGINQQTILTISNLIKTATDCKGWSVSDLSQELITNSIALGKAEGKLEQKH